MNGSRCSQTQIGMKISASHTRDRQSIWRFLQTAYRLTFALACILALAPNTAYCHTTDGFLPLQFEGYHAPFGFDETEAYTDVWGTEDFAYLGSQSSGVAIIDIGDPTSMTTSAVFGGSLGVAFSDIRVLDETGYFSTDSGGTYIVDLSIPSSPTSLNQVSAADGGFGSVTNAIVGQNHLFQVSDSSSEIAVFDVSDPFSPTFVTRIDTSDSVGVYDLSIQGNRLYAAGLGGLSGEGAAYIYDISNLNSGSASLLGQVATGANTASVATNDDQSKLLVTHRETGGTLAAWDISDLSASIELESIDASDLDVNSLSAANVVVLDSTAYVAWHQAGVQVIDLDLLEQTDTLFRVGAFGTSQASPLEGFVGNTSVHPVGHDQVLLSDSRWGLYVVDATNVVSLPGDFNEDGVVDADDIDFYSGQIGLASSDTGFDSRLDWDVDGVIDIEDHNFHIENHVVTSNGVTGALLGDTNLDGSVDVLNDAFTLVGNLNSTGPYSYASGDLNADQRVDVLGDAFTLIGNLGQTTDSIVSTPTTSSVPEPGSTLLIGLMITGIIMKRRRNTACV